MDHQNCLAFEDKVQFKRRVSSLEWVSLCTYTSTFLFIWPLWMCPEHTLLFRPVMCVLLGLVLLRISHFGGGVWGQGFNSCLYTRPFPPLFFYPPMFTISGVENIKIVLDVRLNPWKTGHPLSRECSLNLYLSGVHINKQTNKTNKQTSKQTNKNQTNKKQNKTKSKTKQKQNKTKHKTKQ